MEAVAKLNNYPTSTRKMRLLADLIRGMKVEKALGVLQFNPKHPATPLYKLLKSAINNWEQKNSGEKVEDADLIVKTIMVDGGRVIKRMRPAPQGRGYRVRKRSNHVTIIVDSMNAITLPSNGKLKTAKVNATPDVEEVKQEAAPATKTKKAAPKKAAAKKAAPKKAAKKSDESKEENSNK